MGRVLKAIVLIALLVSLSLAGYGVLYLVAILVAVASGVRAPIDPRRQLAICRFAWVTVPAFSVAYCGLALVVHLLPSFPDQLIHTVHDLLPDDSEWAVPWRLLLFGPLAMDTVQGASYAWLVAGALSVPIAFAADRAVNGGRSYEPPATVGQPVLLALLLTGLMIVALSCGLFLLATGMMFFGGTDGPFGLVMIWACGALASFALAAVAEFATYAAAIFRAG
jgi:hypothetical protein